MKVDRPYTLQDSSLNLHRLDAALLHSFAWKHPSGLDVLQSRGSVRYGEQLHEKRLRHLIGIVEAQYLQEDITPQTNRQDRQPPAGYCTGDGGGRH